MLPLMSVPTPVGNALNAITMSACGYSGSKDVGPSESLQEDAVISRLRSNTTAVFGLILARILFDCQNSFGYFKIATPSSHRFTPKSSKYWIEKILNSSTSCDQSLLYVVVPRFRVEYCRLCPVRKLVDRLCFRYLMECKAYQNYSYGKLALIPWSRNLHLEWISGGNRMLSSP